MPRETTVERAAVILAIAALLLGPGTALADDAPPAEKIVPPSGYVEGIETPGKTAGNDRESDAAAARAAAATTAVPVASADGGERVAAIATDLLIGRPTALIATVAGSAFFALSLPITAPSGRSAAARERLVDDPVKHLIDPLGK